MFLAVGVRTACSRAGPACEPRLTLFGVQFHIKGWCRQMARLTSSLKAATGGRGLPIARPFVCIYVYKELSAW